MGHDVQQVRFLALVLWAMGVQVHELLGTVGMALLVATFVPELGDRRWWKPWWPVWAFIGWSLLGPLVFGQLPSGAGVARTFDWAAIPFAAATAGTLTTLQWRRLAVVTFSALLLSCTMAGLQHFGVWPREAAFESLGWMQVPFGRVYEPIADSGRFMGGGLLFHRLKFSHVSGLALVALVVAHARARSSALVLALVFAFGALWLFPYARMGAVAMTLAVGVTAVLTSAAPRRAVLVAVGLALAGGVVVLAVEPLRDRFEAALTDHGSGQRTQHLSAGLAAIRQFPWAGVGVGQFRPSKFGGSDMADHVKENPGKAHNQFISVAAETGVLGGVGFIALLGWLFVRARRSSLGALTMGALVSFAVLSLAHDPLFQAPYSMGLVLVVGLGLSGFGGRRTTMGAA